MIRAVLSASMICVAAVASGAVAAAPEGWQCASCSSGQPWELDLAFAPAYVGDDAYRFGDYTGLDEKDAYLFGEFFGRYRNDSGNYFQFDGFMLSPDASAVFLEGGRQGRYRVTGAYRAIPRRFYDATLTPFLGNGTETLALPDGWVRGPNTASMSALPETLQPVKVRSDRDVLVLGVEFRAESRWTFNADISHTERQGRKLDAGSFLFSAAEFVSPVDYTTDDLSLSARYQGEGWQTEVAYSGSFFENGNEALAWENPFTAVPGADVGVRALAPDNEAHRFTLSGAWRLPKRTTLSGHLGFGRLTQDTDLLPYTANPALTPGPESNQLPMLTADARVNTLNLNLRAVTSPWRKTTFEARFRLEDFDNETPVNAYDYVITDALPKEFPVSNRPYDRERTELKLRGEYRATAATRLHFGFDTKTLRRNLQDRDRTRTDRLWFTLRQRAGRYADVDLDVFVEDRDGSSYEVLDNPLSQQNPLMRKYNLADRERSGLKVRASVYPAERWDLGFELETGTEDYTESLIGLTETDFIRGSINGSWLVLGQGTLFASYDTERFEVQQASSQSFGIPDWTATTEDEFDTGSLGFEHPELFGPVGFRFEYGWSKGRGRTESDTSGLARSFPDLKSRRETIGFGLDYALSETWQLAFDYYREEVDSSDWALDGLEPATVPNLLILGANPFNYDVNVVYLTVRYLRRP